MSILLPSVYLQRLLHLQKSFISFYIKIVNVYRHIMLWNYWCAKYFEPMQWYKNEMTNGVLSKANIGRLKYIFTFCANKWYIFKRIIYMYICIYIAFMTAFACYLIFCVSCKMIFCQKYHIRSFWWDSKLQTEIYFKVHSSMNEFWYPCWFVVNVQNC